ncbi:MAG: Tol-Pal system beta propeller repeat protein TolB [Proteobacteria bacterium]|nr:Tol-Pal system beta propeller repeat protein TolB [Pseudomonadota bacterium]
MRKIKLILILFCYFFIFSAQAELYMELNQGMNQAIPIAISPLTGPVAMASGNETLDAIIRHDLNNSGQFLMTAANSADYQLQGSISEQGPNQYSVTFELKRAFNTPVGGSPLLFKKVFQVKHLELRQLAHTVSDSIYEQLCGVHGIFNTKIAYILKQWPKGSAPLYALEVADYDGFNPQTLLVSPSPLMSPTWSPDGHQIAYVSFENNHAAIYLQNLDTGQRRLITSFEGINGAPAFSPDGAKMAVVLTKTDNPKIYVVNLNTLSNEQITDGYSIDTEPLWSADGRSLIFTSDRDGAPQIYRYVFATGQISRLTYQGNYNAKASLSADNKTMIIMHRENGVFGIAKQDLQTGELQILANSGLEESPSLAPNGKMVLYATQYQGRGVLALVSIDGRTKVRLPARAGTLQEPAWSPYLMS